jgi:hypothetical protein
MPSRQERRAAALEAIAHALLELAAVEREPEEKQTAREILIDHRNCEAELGLARRAFTAAAGRDFPAFRVSKRQTATKEDVLAWLKSRTVEPKAKVVAVTPPRAPDDPDSFLKAVHARFVAKVGRPMTDYELDSAEICISVGKHSAKMTGREYTGTADDVARQVEEHIGKEPAYYEHWRTLGLDPTDMEKRAEDLRVRLHQEHPQMGWRERMNAVYKMWDEIDAPLSEARRAQRAAARAAKKAERAKKGELGLKK